ncbi:uncharacterized protein LOC132048368 [Lycium ferocissimum]|uniref:uncharacterized protein LOC132048368 n=1 Tax=Lycium ferocissimum TaxID=112874 RepID=UPI00281515BA|nr:uncharacterized protein LOC132048368 [Lycium ferocissimum]
MTPLSTCWLLIELYVIPHGFLKWFFLSFNVHPFFLVICQLYLWIKVLLGFLLTFFLFVYRFSCFLISYVLRLHKLCVLFSKKYSIDPNKNPVIIEEVEEYFDIPNTESQNEIVLYTSLNMRSTSNSCGTVNLNMKNKSYDDMIYVYDFQTRVSQMFAKNHKISSLVEPNQGESMKLEEHEENLSHEVVDGCSVNSSVDENKNSIFDNYNVAPLSPGPILSYKELEQEFSVSDSVSSFSPGINHPGLDEYFPSPISSNLSSPLDYGTLNQNFPSLSSHTNDMVMDQQLVYTSYAEEEVDFLYEKYAESMSWFDVLNHDRLCALSAVLRKHLSSPNAFDCEMKANDIQYISLSKVAKKRLVRSLESDLELVYVAQSCLSWEALHHQYKKVEALSCSTSKNGVFYGKVAARFQKFQVLLERFVEDDSCGGKRHLNYVHRRISQKNLLQVPEVSGYVESNERLNGETSKAIEVLKAIEKCISAFWFYVRTDSKKRLWSQSRVEDPRDILLRHDLIKKLQMKELWVKDVKGKRKCWLRRATKPQLQGEYTKIDFVLTLIDMKLVSKVLHMSIISKSHLKWCQQKLNNIEFKDGQILRTPTSLLFPS